MTRYRHTQVGTLVLVALGIALALSTTLCAAVPEAWAVSGATALLLAACLVTFGTLTVEIDGRELAVWFGPGLVRRRIPLDAIRDAHIVRNRWYYGWGIRLLPSG